MGLVPVAVARWSGQPSNWLLALCAIVHGIVSLAVSFAFVYTSASGLPLASVSNGTAAGMFVPRRRTYCDADTAGMRYDIFRNVEPSTADVTGVHCVAPLLLNVLMTAALRFFAAAGTTER